MLVAMFMHEAALHSASLAKYCTAFLTDHAPLPDTTSERAQTKNLVLGLNQFCRLLLVLGWRHCLHPLNKYHILKVA